MSGIFNRAIFNDAIFNTASVEQPVVSTGGGDSTRFRNRGRRPKYFWEVELKREDETKIVEAVYDAVSNAYSIESDGEFLLQISYLKRLERRLAEARFTDIAHQIQISLKDLAFQAEQRKQRAEIARFMKRVMEDTEESEISELMEIL